MQDYKGTLPIRDKKDYTTADIEIGTIFNSSWGYDQTNICYYKVIAKSAKFLTIRAIGQHHIEQVHYLGETVMPNPDDELFRGDYIGIDEALPKGAVEVEGDTSVNYRRIRIPEITRVKLQSDGCLRLSSYEYAYLWNNRPSLQTHTH
jgi:hypothetical protein